MSWDTLTRGNQENPPHEGHEIRLLIAAQIFSYPLCQ